MDSISGRVNEVNDPIKAMRSVVRIFRRKPWQKAEIGDAESYRLKDWRERVIEGAIDKY